MSSKSLLLVATVVVSLSAALTLTPVAEALKPTMLGQVAPLPPFKRDDLNMGTCVASYAYAAKVALEYGYFYAFNERLDIRVHELIYCDQENNECMGGYPERSLDYALYYGLEKLYYAYNS